MSECRRYLVSGKVQGVFFRASTVDEARRLGLRGWVRNLPDGRVEALASGDARVLDLFYSWLHEGPRWAQVDHVQQIPENADASFSDFSVR